MLHYPGDHDRRSIAYAVYVDLYCVLEEAVYQYRVLGRCLDRPYHVVHEAHLVIDYLHCPSAEHVRRPHHDRISDGARYAYGLVYGTGGAAVRLSEVKLLQEPVEPLPVLCHVYRIGRGAQYPDACPLQRDRELQRGLAAELDYDAFGLLLLDYRHDILECKGLEVEPVGGVVVGGEGLGVAVDHYRFYALFAERKARVNAAVVELDALPYPVRAAAEYHDLSSIGRRGLTGQFFGSTGRYVIERPFVRRIEVRR